MIFEGMNNADGTSLNEFNHLRQSIIDILTTPIGTRVMRRDYGSRIYDLIDAPLNSNTLMQLFAATADALAIWEPRLRITAVSATQGTTEGSVIIDVTGKYLPGGMEVSIEGIIIADGDVVGTGKKWDTDGLFWDSGLVWG